MKLIQGTYIQVHCTSTHLLVRYTGTHGYSVNLSRYSSNDQLVQVHVHVVRCISTCTCMCL